VFILKKKSSPEPLQRGDNYKNAKMGWVYLKIFFSKTTEPVRIGHRPI
jgi:hypothetical protein